MKAKPLSPVELASVTRSTIEHYDSTALAFRQATWDHDVTQNYAALLGAVAQEKEPPFALLDLGCGPGRDVAYFKALGHDVTGLDGSLRFVEMTRASTGCDVLHQSFLALALPAARFDGIFANASLFHVPRQELPRVLAQLHASLAPRGVLFSSNPRGVQDSESLSGERYGVYHTLETWREYVLNAGFDELSHYYRPEGKPREEQPWLASVWRKREST